MREGHAGRIRGAGTSPHPPCACEPVHRRYPQRAGVAHAEAVAATNAVRLKRVYDPADSADGRRILVDRLWPRGLPKAAAEIDEWEREVAPSTELRRWWNHDPERFDEFADRYRAELAAGSAVDELVRLASEGTVTLLTATKDEHMSHAAVLAAVLEERLAAR